MYIYDNKNSIDVCRQEASEITEIIFYSVNV